MSGDKVPLSVVIITKDEEENIKACLETVLGWADEVIVVDDESTDKTVEIAQGLGAKVLRRKMDIEGRQRNWAYQQARNLWVLSLDADERLSKELQEEIASLLWNNPEEAGFSIPRRNYIGDYWVRYSGWYPAGQLKLFRKDKFRYEETYVHPRAFLDGSCGHLKKDLIHFSYENLEDFLSKLNRQTSWEAEKWFSQDRPMRLGRFLWRTLDRFIRSYFVKKGYRDGFYGFAVAFFAGLYQFISYLKYQELKRLENKSF